MRILVFGAGVIGSLYGALLAEAGYDVSVYARGRRLESLTQDGLLYKRKGKDTEGSGEHTVKAGSERLL